MPDFSLLLALPPTMRPFTIISPYHPGPREVYLLTVLYISLVIPLTQAFSHVPNANTRLTRAFPSSLVNFFPPRLSSNFSCSMKSSLFPLVLKDLSFFIILYCKFIPQSSAFTWFVYFYVDYRLSSPGLGTMFLHMCLKYSDL